MPPRARQSTADRSSSRNDSPSTADDSVLVSENFDQEEAIRAASRLPLWPSHVWKGVVIVKDALRVFGTMDMTHMITSGATRGYVMNFQQIQNSDDANGVIQGILQGMVETAKSPENLDRAQRAKLEPFFCPRRPLYILLDPDLSVTCFAAVKAAIEQVGTSVRSYSQDTVREAVTFMRDLALFEHPQCTFRRGMEHATAALVRRLPQAKDETWKVRLFDYPESPSGLLLVVEIEQPSAASAAVADDAEKSSIYNVVGSGPTGLSMLSRGVLATMQAPVQLAESGKGFTSSPRRPGRIVLHTTEGGLGKRDVTLLQQALLGSGVQVLDSNSQCAYPGCVKSETDHELRMKKCPCMAVRYCDKSCQSAHWTVHRQTCSWYANMRKRRQGEGT